MTKADALKKIEEILIADYPAEEERIQADVAGETKHAKCSPIWLHDMARDDSSFTDEAMELVRDVCDAYYYTN